MLKILRNRADSPINVVWIMIMLVFLGLHTVLFTRVSDRLDKALERVDKLEVLLINVILNSDQHTKEIAMDELRHIRNGLDNELRQTAHRTILRSRRSDSQKPSPDVENHGKRITRVEKQVKKCLERMRKIKERRKPRRVPRNNLSKTPQPPKSCCTSKPAKPTIALFTIWGEVKCFRRGSKLVLKGQVVLVDGSDFHCLSDQNPNRGTPPEKKRYLGSHVSIRGVTYGDIEMVDNFGVLNPPTGGRNNNTVPCVICSRENKTSSVMLLASPEAKSNGLNFRREEYLGILMTAKESKQAICVAKGAKVYRGKQMAHPRIKDTAQLHPAELNCDSVRCSANSRKYKNGNQIGCSVITI